MSYERTTLIFLFVIVRDPVPTFSFCLVYVLIKANMGKRAFKSTIHRTLNFLHDFDFIETLAVVAGR